MNQTLTFKLLVKAYQINNPLITEKQALLSCDNLFYLVSGENKPLSCNLEIIILRFRDSNGKKDSGDHVDSRLPYIETSCNKVTEV